MTSTLHFEPNTNSWGHLGWMSLLVMDYLRSESQPASKVNERTEVAFFHTANEASDDPQV
jgi:hypothetical protein